jgi:type IV secretion system protein VirB8
MKKILNSIKTKFKKVKVKTSDKSKAFCKEHKLVNHPLTEESVAPYDYFTLARSWNDDFYTCVEASRNRWKAFSLWLLTPVSIVLLTCTVMLIPAQHLEPLMINHYNNGLTTVVPFKQAYSPKSQSQVESDIARYVRFRESYSSSAYDYSYRLINLMSSPAITKGYDQEQSSSNKNAPIRLLGEKGYRTVTIESIVFLDSKDKNNKSEHEQNHRNLAQVNFVVTDHDKKSGSVTSTPLTTLVSWKYRGTPNDPSDRWMDWNGFTVTTYQVQQRNV